MAMPTAVNSRLPTARNMKTRCCLCDRFSNASSKRLIWNGGKPSPWAYRVPEYMHHKTHGNPLRYWTGCEWRGPLTLVGAERKAQPPGRWRPNMKTPNAKSWRCPGWLQRLVGLLLLPFIPLLAVATAIWAVLEVDSITRAASVFGRQWWQSTLAGLARCSFWPDAGWCYHAEPHGWQLRFVLTDPCKPGEWSWAWNWSDCEHIDRYGPQANKEAANDR